MSTAPPWSGRTSLAYAAVLALAVGAGVLVIRRAQCAAGSAVVPRPPLAVTVKVLEAPRASLAGGLAAASRLDDAWEVTVDASGAARGALLLLDAAGRAVSPPFDLQRVPPTAPSVSAFVPLRSFPPQAGVVRGLLVVGAPECVAAATRDALAARGDAEGRARQTGEACAALIKSVPLADAAPDSVEDGAVDRAEQLLLAGEPDEALVLADRARARGVDAARANAVAAEAAFSLGRNALARSIGETGLGAADLAPRLRARLLRTSILAQAETGGASLPDRDVLRATEGARPQPIERALDAALDLRIALDHDRFAAPPEVPAAARSLVMALRDAGGDVIAACAAMACRAARSLTDTSPSEGRALLERATREADRSGSLADRAFCAFAAGDTARDAGRLADAERFFRRAIELLGDHPLPREQREAWFSAALLSERRADYAAAFAESQTASSWVDFSLSLSTNLAEREALLWDCVAYYGAAERFGILANDPRRAVAAGEWGKGRAFGALLGNASGLEQVASGAFIVIGDLEQSAREERLDVLARSLRPGDAALSYTFIGADSDQRKLLGIAVVTHERVTARPSTYSEARLCSDVRALGEAVQAGDVEQARIVGGRLYEVLVAPVARELVGARRVFVSPQLCLHGVPWAALYDGAGFLVEKAAFARVPPLLFSARDEADDAPLFDASPSRRWLLAYEPAHPGAAPLPGLVPLAGEIAKRVHPAIDLFGDALTPERFLAATASVDALVFAGHARYDATTPLASALLLTPSPATAADIIEARSFLGLRHRLDLVFLLGCETSRLWGRQNSYSDDAMGLQRAFLAGGARHVLGALWPVLDRDAEDFVHALLAQEGTLDVLSAVGAAQRCMSAGRCPSRGISAWASFMVDAR